MDARQFTFGPLARSEVEGVLGAVHNEGEPGRLTRGLHPDRTEALGKERRLPGPGEGCPGVGRTGAGVDDSGRQCRQTVGQARLGGTVDARLTGERREQVLPEEVELALRAIDLGGAGDDGVEAGQHDAELAEGTVGPVRVMAADPELEAVPLAPVRALLARGVDLLALSLADIALWHQLTAFPTTVAEVQLAELGDSLSL